MINIGLIGESPYDTVALKHLLQQKYDTGYRYSILLKNVTGDHLNTPKAIRAVVSEIKVKQPDIVVVIRDADGLESNMDAIRHKQEWYKNLSGQMNRRSLFLLNIYELEALIFADIDTFNTHYKTSIKGNRNVTYIVKPKDELMRKTIEQKKYAESHCPELFKALKIDIVSKNCTYFKEFLDEFSQLLDGDEKPT